MGEDPKGKEHCRCLRSPWLVSVIAQRKGEMRFMKQSNLNRGGQPSYLRYCLLAVILFGCYVLLNRFQDDNSATMAPNLVFIR
jgi:hypothetical protein